MTSNAAENAPSMDPLEALLEIEDLYSLKQLTDQGATVVPETHRLFGTPTAKHVRKLAPLLEAVRHYYVQKYTDQWVDPVMTHLRFEDFDHVRQEWRQWRVSAEALLNHELEHSREDGVGYHTHFLAELVDKLAHIIEDEQNVGLLQDFQLAVETHLFKDIEPLSRFSNEALKDLQDEKLLGLTAFNNLFTRLLLFAEPVEAAFLARDERDQAVLGYWFQTGQESPAKLCTISADCDLPEWISVDWFNVDRFQELGSRLITDRAMAALGDHVWRVNPINGSPGEPGYLGFYIFCWKSNRAPGFQRFEAQRLAWTIPIQALVYRRAAVEQEELKGRLLSIVAHNLGSPLYLMRSNLDVLAAGRLEQSSERRFTKYRQLLRQARHMDAIVDSILSLSDRKIETSLSEVAISRLVYEVVRTVRPEAKPKNVEIAYPEPTAEQDEKNSLLTDETKVYDIMLNLLVNAVKYSPQGGRVRVSVGSSAKDIQVRVEDQGPGIPKPERTRIFEPFFRGVHGQNVTGLGLGLYTVKLYTDLLQGQIQISEAAEGGSVFTLFLPRQERELY